MLRIEPTVASQLSGLIGGDVDARDDQVHSCNVGTPRPQVVRHDRGQ